MWADSFRAVQRYGLQALLCDADIMLYQQMPIGSIVFDIEEVTLFATRRGRDRGLRYLMRGCSHSRVSESEYDHVIDLKHSSKVHSYKRGNGCTAVVRQTLVGPGFRHRQEL
jgi:hypothetical protein